MQTSLYRDINNGSRRPKRRKPRSPGVILRNRSAGLGYWDDEVHHDGGKRHLHHRVRRLEKEELRRLIARA